MPGYEYAAVMVTAAVSAYASASAVQRPGGQERIADGERRVEGEGEGQGKEWMEYHTSPVPSAKTGATATLAAAMAAATLAGTEAPWAFMVTAVRGRQDQRIVSCHILVLTGAQLQMIRGTQSIHASF